MTNTTDSPDYQPKYDTPTGQPTEDYAGHSHNCHCGSCMGFIPDPAPVLKWECDQCGERIPSTKLDVEAHQESCEPLVPRWIIKPGDRVRLI